MNRTEKELWEGLDHAVFGTDDPDNIQTFLAQAHKELEEENSSLGKYLDSLRRRKLWSPDRMAKEAKISAARWKAWVADYETPTEDDLKKIAQRVGWGEYKLARLLELRGQANILALRRLSRFQPELMAARGTQGVNPEVEWLALSPTLQSALQAWARTRGHQLPAELFQVLGELGSEQEREAWVQDILGEIDG